MAKKKVTKKRQSQKQSEQLKLSGPVPDYSKYKVNKNQEIPEIRQTHNHWDHLIAKLDIGDSIEMEKKDGGSFLNRARNLGYFIVARKREDNKMLIWFGGLK